MSAATPLLLPGPYDQATSGDDRTVGSPSPRLSRRSEEDVVPQEIQSNDVVYTRSERPIAAPRKIYLRPDAVLQGQAEALLRMSPPAILAAVVDALADLNAPSTLDEELWGAPPDDVTYLRAVARSATRIAEQEDALLDRGQTVEETAKRLGIDSGTVLDWIGRRKLVALERDSVTVLPDWQFTDGGRAVLRGVSEVRRSFPGGVLALSTWMVAPNGRLGGRTPRELLVEGDTERVAAVAQVIGS